MQNCPVQLSNIIFSPIAANLLANAPLPSSVNGSNTGLATVSAACLPRAPADAWASLSWSAGCAVIFRLLLRKGIPSLRVFGMFLVDIHFSKKGTGASMQ